MGYLDSLMSIGGVPTPSLAGVSVGASDPTGAYLKSVSAPTASPGMSAPAASSMGVMNKIYSPQGMTPTVGGTSSGSGFGFNTDTLGVAIGGLQALGSLWNAWEANKLAKEQFKFAKEAWNTNLTNQMQTYNTTLEDRIRSRAAFEGMSSEDAQAYIDTHKLRK